MASSSSERWLHVLRDPALDGPENMARDEHLLYDEVLRPAALRLYGWQPATISLGYFQRYQQLAGLPDELQRLAVVRRPTGGGAILHDREVTYALIVDDSLLVARRAPSELYRLVHTCWRDALATDVAACRLAPEALPLPSPRSGPFFCFEKPARTDLIVDGQKLLGSAQRRIPGRVLQHGSLLLGRRFASHPGADLHEPPPERVQRWIAGFVGRLADALALQPRHTDWTPPQLHDVAVRRRRYASPEWTHRR